MSCVITFLGGLSWPIERRVENLSRVTKEIESFTICKELGGGGEEGLQMVLGTFPTKAGIPSRYTNLEMFTHKMWKHDAVSMYQCQDVCAWVCVCVVKGDPWLSWLWLGIGAGGGEDTIRPWFLWLWWHPDNSRHIHKHLFCSEPATTGLSLTHTHTYTNTDTHTRAWKLQLSMQALSRWVA